MMRKMDIKAIFIASLLAVSLTVCIFPLTQTLFYFLFDRVLALPESTHILLNYLPLVLGGIYAGLSVKAGIFAHGILIGILYSVAVDLISLFYVNEFMRVGWVRIVLGPIEDGILCGLFAWTVYKIARVSKAKRIEVSSNRLESDAQNDAPLSRSAGPQRRN